MVKTLVNCPACKKPIQAELQQLFDITAEPGAKQKLLSGTYNLAACPVCGFKGNLSTPIVYHDPDKELLLTFIPPEVGLPKNEQEKIIGSLINQVMSKLPQEKRKAYLLQPQASLTMQGLIDRILEADGITKEMIQAHQARMNLIQKLLNVSNHVRFEILNQEKSLVDADLFTLLDRLHDSLEMGGDSEGEQKLADLQKYLMENSDFGQELSNQMKEVEEAVNSLREAGKELTREKLLDLVIKAPNDMRLRALVSLVRPGMDYVFFQMLSERIDRARGEGRARLVELREVLLTLTNEIDQKVEERLREARELIIKLLESDNISESTLKQLQYIDEFFLQELNRSLEEAQKHGLSGKQEKLNQILQTIQQASSASQAMAFIEALLDASDEKARLELLEKNKEIITPDFISALSNIFYQVQSSNNNELAERFSIVHRQVVRYSMEMNLKSN